MASESPKSYPCGHPAQPGASTLGLCPRCLMQVALTDGPPRAGRRAGLAPLVAEVQAEFPDLEVLELLGQGGMGAVYKARQRDLDRLVAVKLLPHDPAQDPALLERFRHEARVLARLSHPNIVGVHDFGHSARYCCFVMEFVAGPTLRERLWAGPLEPPEALEVARQVCEALDYAHQQGVIHRDIKPENILLEPRGGQSGSAHAEARCETARLADFGLAKLLRRGPSEPTMTQPGHVLGTFHYMAPEQTQDPQHVDHRADIYAVGVVLYEMLTGGLPLGRFPLPSELTEADKRLDELVLRCLEKDPGRRFQHARELLEALSDCAASPARGRPGALGRRGRWAIAAGGLAVALAAAALVARSRATRPEAHAGARSGAPSTLVAAPPTRQEPSRAPPPPDEDAFLPEFLVPYPHLSRPQYASIREGRHGFLLEMAATHGPSRLAMFWVHGLPGDVGTYVHDQVMAIVGTTRCDGIGAFDSLNIVVAPVDDLEGLAAKVAFGEVTGLDSERRIIHVQADPSRLPPPLPREAMDPEAPGFYRQSLEDLGCWDRHRRLRVAVRLVDAPPTQLRREIAAALEALLRDPSAQTRKVAAQALGTWGDASHLPALRAAAAADDARVAEAARAAIADIDARAP